MKKGLFIVFEGPDGAGKTTILKLLEERLYKDYKTIKTVATREPGGTNNKIAEDIRNILLNKEEGFILDNYAEALLFAASRSQHIHDFIVPNLEANNIVLCDRFVHSSLVYQGIARGLGIDNILKINKFAMHGVEPDLVIFLMCKPEKAIERLMQNSLREINRLDKESIDFKRKIYNAYQKIAKDNKKIVVIDANDDNLEKKVDACYQVIKKYIKKKYGK